MSLIEDIKREAVGNNTKIQTSEAAEFEKVLNKAFYLEKKPEEESEFVKQVVTRGMDSSERVGLHASALIVSDNQFCLRQQVLSLIYKQRQNEKNSVNLQRIFEQGNAIHEKWQRLFLRAGYSTVNELDYTRLNKKYRVSYTPDIVCKVPEFFDGKMIGEIKSVNTFQFKKMTKHPSAGKQLQWYMALCIEQEKINGTWNGKDYTMGFVLSEDKNTQDFKIEIYQYDPEKTEVPISRCIKIKESYKRLMKEHKMVARPSDAKSSDCKRCSDCPMRDACWNIGMGKVRI